MGGFSAFRSTLIHETFDNRALNLTALAEIVIAVAVTQVDGFNRLLGTRPLTAGQFGLALAAAVVMFAVWEAGKLVARRRKPCSRRRDCWRCAATGRRGCATTWSPASC